MLTDSQEHFWGVELTKDKPTFTWTFKEEDEDEDYMVHTLFLKNAVLSNSALKGERNIIQVETQNFDKKDIKQPLLSLTLGQMDMCNLDVSFGHETPVTFRLVEGAGPVALGGQQLVEFPPEELNSQDESALEDSTMESELTEDDSPKKSRKRKAASAADKKVRKKGKMEEDASSADSEEDEEDEVEDEEEEDSDDEEDMEEDETSSPDKKKKKGKGTGRRARSRSRSTGRSSDLKVTLKKGTKRRIVKAKRKASQ